MCMTVARCKACLFCLGLVRRAVPVDYSRSQRRSRGSVGEPHSGHRGHPCVARMPDGLVRGHRRWTVLGYFAEPQWGRRGYRLRGGLPSLRLVNCAVAPDRVENERDLSCEADDSDLNTPALGYALRPLHERIFWPPSIHAPRSLAERPSDFGRPRLGQSRPLCSKSSRVLPRREPQVRSHTRSAIRVPPGSGRCAPASRVDAPGGGHAPSWGASSVSPRAGRQVGCGRNSSLGTPPAFASQQLFSRCTCRLHLAAPHGRNMDRREFEPAAGLAEYTSIEHVRLRTSLPNAQCSNERCWNDAHIVPAPASQVRHRKSLARGLEDHGARLALQEKIPEPCCGVPALLEDLAALGPDADLTLSATQIDRDVLHTQLPSSACCGPSSRTYGMSSCSESRPLHPFWAGSPAS